MKNRGFRITRALTLAVAISPLPAMAAWGLLLVLAPAASFAGQSNTGQIGSFFGNLCLQPVNDSTAQGAAIVQQPCDNRPSQQWSKLLVGGNTYHYVNELSKMCLDARGAATNHTPVQQWTCNKITNENWAPGDDSNETIPPLISRISGGSDYCLDQPGGQAVAGLAVQIYRCNNTLAQAWYTP